MVKLMLLRFVNDSRFQRLPQERTRSSGFSSRLVWLHVFFSFPFFVSLAHLELPCTFLYLWGYSAVSELSLDVLSGRCRCLFCCARHFRIVATVTKAKAHKAGVWGGGGQLAHLKCYILHLNVLNVFISCEECSLSLACMNMSKILWSVLFWFNIETKSSQWRNVKSIITHSSLCI
jgi:hypothetical protein